MQILLSIVGENFRVLSMANQIEECRIFDFDRNLHMSSKSHQTNPLKNLYTSKTRLAERQGVAQNIYIPKFAGFLVP